VSSIETRHIHAGVFPSPYFDINIQSIAIMHSSAVFVALLAGIVCAKPVHKLKRQVIEDSYDYIIAGGMFTPRQAVVYRSLTSI
jgi:hypothetical protein